MTWINLPHKRAINWKNDLNKRIRVTYEQRINGSYERFRIDFSFNNRTKTLDVVEVWDKDVSEEVYSIIENETSEYKCLPMNIETLSLIARKIIKDLDKMPDIRYTSMNMI